MDAPDALPLIAACELFLFTFYARAIVLKALAFLNPQSQGDKFNSFAKEDIQGEGEKTDLELSDSILYSLLQSCPISPLLPTSSFLLLPAPITIPSGNIYHSAQSSSTSVLNLQILKSSEAVSLSSTSTSTSTLMLFMKKVYSGFSQSCYGNTTEHFTGENIFSNRLFPFSLLRNSNEYPYSDFYAFSTTFPWVKNTVSKDRDPVNDGMKYAEQYHSNKLLLSSISANSLFHLLPVLESYLFPDSVGSLCTEVSPVTAASAVDSLLLNIMHRASQLPRMEKGNKDAADDRNNGECENKNKNENENDVVNKKSDESMRKGRNNRRNSNIDIKEKAENGTKCRLVLKALVEECTVCFEAASTLHTTLSQDLCLTDWLQVSPLGLGNSGGLGSGPVPGPGQMGCVGVGVGGVFDSISRKHNPPPNVLWAYRTLRTLLSAIPPAHTCNTTQPKGGKLSGRNGFVYCDPLKGAVSSDLLFRLLRVGAVGNVSLRFAVFEIVTLLLTRINVQIENAKLSESKFIAEDVKMRKSKSRKTGDKKDTNGNRSLNTNNSVKEDERNSQHEEKEEEDVCDDDDNVDDNMDNNRLGNSFSSAVTAASDYYITIANERKIVELFGFCLRVETLSENKDNHFSSKTGFRPFSRYMKSVCGLLLQWSVLRKSLGLSVSSHVHRSIIDDWTVNTEYKIRNTEDGISEQAAATNTNEKTDNCYTKSNSEGLVRGEWNLGSPVLLITQLSPNSIAVSWSGLPVGAGKSKGASDGPPDRKTCVGVGSDPGVAGDGSGSGKGLGGETSAVPVSGERRPSPHNASTQPVGTSATNAQSHTHSNTHTNSNTNTNINTSNVRATSTNGTDDDKQEVVAETTAKNTVKKVRKSEKTEKTDTSTKSEKSSSRSPMRSRTGTGTVTSIVKEKTDTHLSSTPMANIASKSSNNSYNNSNSISKEKKNVSNEKSCSDSSKDPNTGTLDRTLDQSLDRTPDLPPVPPLGLYIAVASHVGGFQDIFTVVSSLTSSGNYRIDGLEPGTIQISFFFLESFAVI